MAYIDLAKELKSNDRFRDKLQRYAAEIQRIERSNRPAEQAKASEIRAEIWRTCKYNPALILPYFFPNFDRERAFHAGDRPYSYALFNFCPGGYTVVRGSRQGGKSTSFGIRQLIMTRLIRGWRTGMICPHTEHKKTYGDKLRELEAVCRLPDSYPGKRNNLFFKEYPHGSRIEILRILTSAASARGKTFDELIYDEYQLFNPDFEGELRPMQTNSDWPTTLYAGTSTWLDSPLESRFQSSSMGTWHIRTFRAGKYVDCGDPEQIFRIIGPDGPVCPYTGQKLDVSDGFFVHRYKDRLEENLIGLHVPQVAIPEFATNYNKWSKIALEFKRGDRNKFVQEILGIPVESGHREVTEARLEQICANQDDEKTRRKKALSGHYKFVISGCDWGGSENDPIHKVKTSFTVHVIIGLAPDGVWDILFMRRYPGTSYMQIASQIIKDHVSWGACAIGSDSGGGMAYNSFLHASGKIDTRRHMIFLYGGLPSTPMLAPAAVKDNHNLFVLNRGESLSSLYTDINSEPPQFRCYSWGEAREYLMDFMNLMRVIAITRSGQKWWQHLRNPAKADDIVHALNYARTVGKVILGRPMFDDEGLDFRMRDLMRGSGTSLYDINREDNSGQSGGMMGWG